MGERFRVGQTSPYFVDQDPTQLRYQFTKGLSMMSTLDNYPSES
jgi:hypothetical protein